MSFKENRVKPRGSTYTVECWFDRAVRFTPNDGAVRVLFGIYLLRQGEKQRAITQFEEAQRLAGDDPNIPYNLGLAYFDLGDYEKALAQAHRAYALGFPLPGLRHKLQQAGKWREP
ncbi:MAG: tetratricopeptide repeat protein [Tepidisphaeraceae bacterium]